MLYHLSGFSVCSVCVVWVLFGCGTMGFHAGLADSARRRFPDNSLISMLIILINWYSLSFCTPVEDDNLILGSISVVRPLVSRERLHGC